MERKRHHLTMDKLITAQYKAAMIILRSIVECADRDLLERMEREVRRDLVIPLSSYLHNSVAKKEIVGIDLAAAGVNQPRI